MCSLVHETDISNHVLPNKQVIFFKYKAIMRENILLSRIWSVCMTGVVSE